MSSGRLTNKEIKIYGIPYKLHRLSKREKRLIHENIDNLIENMPTAHKQVVEDNRDNIELKCMQIKATLEDDFSEEELGLTRIRPLQI